MCCYPIQAYYQFHARNMAKASVFSQLHLYPVKGQHKKTNFPICYQFCCVFFDLYSVSPERTAACELLCDVFRLHTLALFTWSSCFHLHVTETSVPSLHLG